MSIADSPDFLFRPEDKAMKMLFPSTENPIHNSFDEYFDKELYGSGQDNGDKESPPLEDIFATDCAHDCSPSPSKIPIFKREATPQPWRNGLWCLNSKSNSDLSVEKTRRTSRAIQRFISPTHLTRDVLSSSELSTKEISTKPRPDSSAHQCTGQTASRGRSFPSTPTRGRPTANGRMGYEDTWEQDLQNFHLQMPDNGTYLSPQQVENFRGNELALSQANSRIHAYNAAVSRRPESPTKYHYPFSHVLRPVKYHSGPDPVDQHAHVHTSTSKANTEQLEFANFAVDAYSAPVWTTESLHSSDSSHYSRGSHFSSECNRQTNSTLPTQAWTSPPPNTTMHYPIFTNSSGIAAPVPHRIPHRVLDQSHTTCCNGLGIDFVGEDAIGRALPYEPDQDHLVQRHVTSPSAAMASFPTYPPLPPLQQYAFSDISPEATIRGRALSLARSPTPSISPTRRAISQGPVQRSPNRTEGSHNNHHRRKSIHKAGPIKESSNNEGTPNHHQQHHRTRSSSRPPRTPRTPKTPTTSTATTTTTSATGPAATPVQTGLFVNYTPKDSIKLMSDVAPSGSSKTRARREQEAREKRKRLSEAALLAVRRAGGDVRALEDAILV